MYPEKKMTATMIHARDDEDHARDDPHPRGHRGEPTTARLAVTLDVGGRRCWRRRTGGGHRAGCSEDDGVSLMPAILQGLLRCHSRISYESAVNGDSEFTALPRMQR